MNTTIYEAVAKYKKDDTLPYTEYFSLGDFSTKDLAENAIMLAKQLPGFREFCDENFYIEEFVLNDGVPRNYSVDDPIKNNEVFILWYGYDVDAIYTVGGTLGVNDTLRMYKNDDIRMYNFNCITDTIVEVITTCNTYTLLTVHLL